MADRAEQSVETGPFNGCKILIVEDEHLIAEDISAMLRDAGAEVIGPAASLPEAMRIAADTATIDAAVLNIDLSGVTVFPLAKELQGRGVKIMFLTGYDDDQIPGEYQSVPCCKKPTGAACVIDELRALLAVPA
ncbi:MAG TPA: response regulator [Sphingomicrobium sp.]|nr:response regulator [Sphingomicrobium sp.]